MFSIGIPKEIKSGEFRVAGLPSHVRLLRKIGCEIFVQRGAGAGAGYGDAQYQDAGAVLVESLADVYRRASFIWKVKEILPEEFPFLRPEQVIFAYLHPCPRPEMIQAFQASRCTAIGYEDVVENGRRPLLIPMSKIAGAGAVLLAGQFAQTLHGGCGKLLFATGGAEPMTFAILGGGTAGRAACAAAIAAGCDVHLWEANSAMLAALQQEFPRAQVIAWSPEAFAQRLPRVDVLMNCTMWMPGDPHLLTRPMLKLLCPGSLIMDVSADPQGAIQTSETTTHDDPLRRVDGILHYCVQNIPSLFARSSSQSLSAATWPYLESIVRGGLLAAVRSIPSLGGAFVAHGGRLFGADLGRIQGIATGNSDDLLRMLE
jgi:alanine dehydrogenase